MPSLTTVIVSDVASEQAACIRSIGTTLGIKDVEARVWYTSHLPDSEYLNIKVRNIPPIRSKSAYNHWMIHEMHSRLETTHMLIHQADGMVSNAHLWNPDWLQYDYIGALWPKWLLDSGYAGASWNKSYKAPTAPYTVGNGGFSLRSKRLMERVSQLVPKDAEDYLEDAVICLDLGNMLRKEGFQFAPPEVAARFAIENYIPEFPDMCPDTTFGWHNNMHLDRVVRL